MRGSVIEFERWLERRRKVVFALWLVIILASAPLALQESTHLTGGGFTSPSSQSAAVGRALGHFPRVRVPDLGLVLTAEPGVPLRPVRVRHDTMRLLSDVRAVSVLPGAVAHRRTIVVPLQTAGGDAGATNAAKRLRTLLGATPTLSGVLPGSPGIRANVIGQGAVFAAVQAGTQGEVEVALARGLPIIAIVLLTVFGSLTATALPLVLGGVTLLVSAALIYLLSLRFGMSVFVTNVASLLGLGVAVDYSLFILTRYREEVGRGQDPAQARAVALSTSGVAVVFSGVTVMCSLAGLFLIGSQALSSIAVGGILVVAVAVLTASTVLPVLAGRLGPLAYGSGILGRGAPQQREASGSAFWSRWTNVVMRRPVIYAVAVLVGLLALASPVISLHMENPGLQQVGAHDPIRVALARADQTVGPGRLGPLEILVTAKTGARPGARMLADVRTLLRRDRLLEDVSPPVLSRTQTQALFIVISRRDPLSDAMRADTVRMRRALAKTVGSRGTATIGGTGPEILDFDRLVASSMWRIIGFVLVLSFVILVAFLRSVLLPLKAVLMTALSVLASYGVLVGVFQWGWLSFLGLHGAPYIDTITPPLVVVITFGLSMDYEVFLLTRIRERYETTGDTRQAVAEGVGSSARTITSAATIMVLVFLAFVSVGYATVQRLGLTAATAVALDATVIRLVLLPSTMTLLGRWNWWLPRPLATMFLRGDRLMQRHRGVQVKQVSASRTSA